MMRQEPELRRMALDRSTLIDHLRGLLVERLAIQDEEIASIREAFASDTKSSAGDKHEVGRAMVQQELDKLEEQRAKLIALQQELARVPVDRTYEKAGFGSMVTTDQGSYFIAIGLGVVDVVRDDPDSDTCYAISMASPIGQALKDKRVGDAIDFNGKWIMIKAIK
jgi:transcription elongation GreA/GreB family factor